MTARESPHRPPESTPFGPATPLGGPGQFRKFVNERFDNAGHGPYLPGREAAAVPAGATTRPSSMGKFSLARGAAIRCISFSMDEGKGGAPGLTVRFARPRPGRDSPGKRPTRLLVVQTSEVGGKGDPTQPRSARDKGVMVGDDNVIQQ